MEFDDGGGSGGAPVGGNQSSRRCTIRWRFPLNNKRHVRDTIASEKEKIGQRSTSPTAMKTRRRRGTEAVMLGKLVLKCVYRCATSAKGRA
jgi:hypothetical protein